jgi:hypothetical protein
MGAKNSKKENDFLVDLYYLVDHSDWPMCGIYMFL